MNSISTIILTYNEEKHIERCVTNAFRFSETVYLIDSFSTDSTVEIAKRWMMLCRSAANSVAFLVGQPLRAWRTVWREHYMQNLLGARLLNAVHACSGIGLDVSFLGASSMQLCRVRTQIETVGCTPFPDKSNIS